MAQSVTPQYSLTMRVRLPNGAGSFARVAGAIGKAGGVLGSIDLVESTRDTKVRDIVVLTCSEDHEKRVVEAVRDLPYIDVLYYRDRTTEAHIGGKLDIRPRRPLKNHEDLSMLYTPGVARICRMVQNDPDAARQLTMIGNTVAVVSDGTAVLGLGDIGPVGALPVMEGKAVLFKVFGKVDAVPICLNTKDVDEIVETVYRISPVFGGINLEDISAPHCFDVEDKLKERLNIPVFHDDQHGTAVVVAAALINAVKVIERDLADLRITLVGTGAAGTNVASLILDLGATDITLVDKPGILHPDDTKDDHPRRRELIERSNPRRIRGSLADAIKGADVLIGVSAPNIVTEEMVASMAPGSIVFAMANPTPEIAPEIAARHARIVATGRSDYPNQINNVLCFPGLFRGLLDCGATKVTTKMKLAAARGIASVLDDSQLGEESIIPSVFNENVAPRVAEAVSCECS
jgi:malate dehydrogenase (oxaloacetate-decarboxylating)